MLLFYIFLASFAGALVSKPLRIDPILIILPSSLLLSSDASNFLNVFISLFPCLLLFSLSLVFPNRKELEVERITRMAAGVSLGSFIGVQGLFLLPFSLTSLILLMVVGAALSLIFSRYRWLDSLSISGPLPLWSGLILGIGQTISLGVGGWILSGLHQLSPVNRYVLWCMALIGALIGFVALPPNEVSYGISWPVMLANGLGLALGALVLKYVLVSRFESKVLQWTVLAMCFSVWGHVLVKHFILPS